MVKTLHDLKMETNIDDIYYRSLGKRLKNIARYIWD